MLHYTVVFCLIVFIVSVLGFGDVAGFSAQNGRILAVIATIFLAVALLGSRLGLIPLQEPHPRAD